MSLFLFKSKKLQLFVLGLILSSTAMAHGVTDTVYIKEVEKVKLPSFRFVPSSYMVQYAGSIGLVSAGFGWDYSKRKRWSTDVLIGYVPKYDSDRAKLTFTLRQTYTPWKVEINEDVRFHPLRTGLFVSTTAGRQFWMSAPDKYPSNYYTFSTKIRFNLFLGQDFEYKFRSNSSYFERVKFYYDVHTNDLYLISRVQNKYLKGEDYLGLALGMKLLIRK